MSRPHRNPTLPPLSEISNVKYVKSEITIPTSEIVPTDQSAVGNRQSQIPDLTSLSPRQQSAFQLLTTGVKPANVAKQIQIHRKTLSRWMSGNVHFIAALNAWKHQTRQLGHARTLSMSDLALDTIESALKSGDPKIAMQIADRLGLFDKSKPGPQTPADVARQRARKALKKQIRIA